MLWVGVVWGEEDWRGGKGFIWNGDLGLALEAG